MQKQDVVDTVVTLVIGLFIGIIMSGCAVMRVPPDVAFKRQRQAILIMELSASEGNHLARCDAVKKSWSACLDAGFPPNDCGFDPFEHRQSELGCR